MKILFISFVIAFSSLICFAQDESPHRPITLDELLISVPKDSSREVAYTNKQAGVYYTETNGIHRSAWQGWRVMSNEMMEDYVISIDGRRLEKSGASAKVYPHQLIRTYPDGIEETVTLLDSVNAIVIQLKNVHGDEVAVRSYFADSPNPEDFVIAFDQNVSLIQRKHHPSRTPEENYPVWVGLTLASVHVRSETGSDTIGQTVSPAEARSSITNHNATIILVIGDTRKQTVSLAHYVSRNYSLLIARRRARMEAVLNKSFLRTDNSRFDKALNWAKLSLDALIMNQRGKGIFAGLPWFDNYWGRDTFISLPALLAMGDFADAKEILQSFAEWQEKDSTSNNYGRIPNLVTNTSIAYNTADGTPRFAIALDEYLKYSGDTSFARKMYPVVKCSIDGTIEYHVDSLCFLTHGDAETWMDAVGPEGPWSPRGNRANDVQALWFGQLKSGSALAYFVNDSIEYQRWSAISDKLCMNFRRCFVDTTIGCLYDHLKTDGTPDRQVRPNQLFAFDTIFLPSFIQAFTNVTESLVYPYGIASLSQEDENFHPYHHYSPYYVQDAAYHNGIVWTWLAGRWIDLATQLESADSAYRLTDNMIHQILDRGAVGTLSELLDAASRPGETEPRLSGTFSQAWSLAEFIRSCYQDYLGLIGNATGGALRIAVNPRMPSSFNRADYRISVGEGWIDGEMIRQSDGYVITFLPSEAISGVSLEFPACRSIASSSQPAAVVLSGKQSTTIVLRGSKVVELMSDGKERTIAECIPQTTFVSARFASPHIRSDLKAFRGPSYRLLTNAEIKCPIPSIPPLINLTDPEGDDRGPTGTYVYPKTSYLKPGSFDITHFTLSADAKNIFFKLVFRNLSNPGWHPEYGFQLTYAAIAVDKGLMKDSGQTRVGMNANYTFGGNFAYENIIYIGGGIRIDDARGRTLAEYIPTPGDERNPLGDTRSRTIEFSIPIEIIGVPTRQWKLAVLVGAQDDHGGAGIGEFRSVETVAKEWIGGGKKNPTDPNVYDVILPPDD